MWLEHIEYFGSSWWEGRSVNMAPYVEGIVCANVCKDVRKQSYRGRNSLFFQMLILFEYLAAQCFMSPSSGPGGECWFKSIPFSIAIDQSRLDKVMLSFPLEGSLLGLLEVFSSLVKRITDRDMPLFTFELYCVKKWCLELLEPSFKNKKGGQENYREAEYRALTSLSC